MLRSFTRPIWQTVTRCDQMWPGVTSCNQLLESHNNHQGHHCWGPWQWSMWSHDTGALSSGQSDQFWLWTSRIMTVLPTSPQVHYMSLPSCFYHNRTKWVLKPDWFCIYSDMFFFLMCRLHLHHGRETFWCCQICPPSSRKNWMSREIYHWV